MRYKDVAKGIKEGNRQSEFRMVQGGILTAMMSREEIVTTDSTDNISKITTMNVNQSNGITQVIDSVMIP